jgi:amino acid adenylation domain-containing protein
MDMNEAPGIMVNKPPLHLPLDRGLAEARRYWHSRLTPLPEPSSLPLDRPRGLLAAGVRGQFDFALDGDLHRRLAELTGDGTFLTYTTLVAAVKVCLCRYNGRSRIVVGSFSRQAGNGEDTPEKPSNLLPIVDTLAPEQTFRELLLAVRQTLMDAYAHQQYPFANMLADLEVHTADDTADDRVPLFDVAVGLENIHGAPPPLATDLTLSFRKEADRIAGRIDYAAELFDPETVERFASHLLTIVAGGVADPSSRLADLELLGGGERSRVLVDWNDTDRDDVPREAALHQLFERQAERTPDAVALRSGDEELTYGELSARANRLAHHLRGLGVGPESRVGIHLPRSADMVVALLGVLKAGGAYVPLDPDYPEARLAFMLEDARPVVLLTRSDLATELPAAGARVVRLDADRAEIDRRTDGTPASGVGPDNPAYVIYTSGSTGRPNGVMVPHRAAVNTIWDALDIYGVASGGRVLQFASYSFDASVLETFLAFSRGAALCLASREARLSGPALVEQLRRERITVAVLVPSTLAGMPVEALPDLATMSLGGESATPSLVATWAPRCRLLNCFGPTETAMIATHHVCVGGEAGDHREAPIGRANANNRMYLLDAALRPVPAGVPGEIFVGGDSLARGYLNRPELSAERFVPSPFGEPDGGRPGERLYRTGDLGRWLPAGEIEFLGRLDHQVKVHGLRIELREIELALASHPAIAEAVVVARAADPDGDGQPGDQVLVAYLVARGAAPNVAELRAFLEEKLPAYMVPSFFVPLDALPLNPSGKLDRSALPAPSAARPDTGVELVAPGSPIQQAIAEIWSDLLGISEIGADDNFFDLGGRSLNAMQVMSQISDRFEIDLPLDSFFDHPTLAELAKTVAAALPQPAAPVASEPAGREIPRAPRDRPLPLSFAQQRLWFLHQIMPEGAAALYNGPLPVRLSGRLDVAALECGLREIVRRHEALRTAFGEVDGQPVQIVSPEVSFHLQQLNLEGLPEDARQDKLLRLAEDDARLPFDLGKSPLLRATLVRLAPEEHALLLSIHHIVFDLWSTEVFLQEFSQLYEAFAAGRPSPLPELPVQYADFAVWQREQLRGRLLDDQLAYWRRQLSDLPELDLPFTRQRPEHPTFRGAIETISLPESVAAPLRALSRAEEATLFMTLLAAFSALLYRYRGQEDVVLGTGIANRGRKELEGLIGFFVNTLVMRVDLSGNPTFRTLVQRTRKMALDAYAHQDVPFERVVEELQPERDASHAPLFRAIFGLNNTANTARDRRIELPGLAISNLDTHSFTSKFDMVFAMLDTGDGLIGDVEYSLDLFDPAVIREMLRRFSSLVEAVAADPDLHLIDIPLGDPEETAAASAASRLDVGQFEF